MPVALILLVELVTMEDLENVLAVLASDPLPRRTMAARVERLRSMLATIGLTYDANQTATATKRTAHLVCTNLRLLAKAEHASSSLLPRFRLSR